VAVRIESVVIRAVDEFSTPVAKMALAAGVLDKRLDSLDSTNLETRRNIVAGSRDLDAFGASTRRNASDINQLTGRLSLMAQSAALLGPALVPISAVALPAVAGLASQMGFAAIGAGSMVVAFQGVGDALKSLNKAALEPTAANIEAARLAMKKIGPDAREFVRAFQEFRPVLTDIRDSAAAGWFPGLTESLDHFAVVGPKIADIFEKIGSVGGDLVAGGAESFASGRWADFLEFVEQEAPAALKSLGHVVGDLAHGMAELWMAFDPLNDDFAGWLESVASGFDSWATGLAGTQGFQEFIDYVREVGPQVAETFGSLANAVLQIAEAAAPLGGPVLKAIEGFADAVAGIADSDLGTPILAGVAALSAFRLAARAATTEVGRLALGQRQLSLGFNRIGPAVGTFGRDLNNVARYGTLATDSSKRLSSQLATFGKTAAVVGGVGIAASGVADSFGLANTASLGLIGTLGGPVGVAAGLSAGALMDLRSALTDVSEEFATIPELIASGDLDAMKDKFSQIKQELDSMSDSGGPGLERFKDELRSLGVSDKEVEQFRALGDAISEVEYQLSQVGNTIEGGDALFALLDVTNRLPGGFHNTANAIAAVNAGMEELAGWLDKRAALRGFEDAMKTLNQSLDAGKVNQWAENVDAVGSSLIQMAQHLKGPEKVTFIDDTIASLRTMAADAGPKAQHEIRLLIAQLKDLGGTEARPKIGADDSEVSAKVQRNQRRLNLLNAYKANPDLDLNDSAFLRAYGITKKDLEWLDRQKVEPKVDVDPTDSFSTLGRVSSLLNGITDKSVTVSVGFKAVGSVAGLIPPAFDADGGFHENGVRTFARGGYGTDGRYYPREPMLIPGGANIMWGEKETGWEAYISGKPSERDRNIGILGMAANRLGVAVTEFAGGGLVDSTFSRSRGDSQFHNVAADISRGLDSVFVPWAQILKLELKAAERRREDLKKDLDAAKEHRDALRDAARSLSENIAGKFAPGSDLLGEGFTVDSVISGIAGLGNQASQFGQLTLRLKAMGLDGAALQWLLENATTPEQLQAFVNGGGDQLAAFENTFNQSAQQQLQAGQNAGWAVMGTQLAAANVELRVLNEKYDRAEERAKRFEQKYEQLQERETAATNRVGDKVDKLAGNVSNSGRR
jgi:hypothetical protein